MSGFFSRLTNEKIISIREIVRIREHFFERESLENEIPF